MAERGGVTGIALTPYQVSIAAGTMQFTRLQAEASGWFGPLAPMAQTVPDAVRGRAFDLPPGYNLNNTPKAYEPISFRTLRALADGYDLLRLVIETRKDQVGRQRWTIKARDKIKKNYDPQIAQITKFFRRPDGVTPWQDWLRSVLEDVFVLDAPALYCQRDKAGNLLALEQLDGADIKRVITDWGRTPQPYSVGGAMVYPVAYQQILKGMPLDYSVRDLIYRPRNRRSHRVYGYSPVEQIITTVNIALRRQQTTLEYFTTGSVPDSLIGVPETWGPAQIRDFQLGWDTLFSDANTAAKRRAKFIPGGMKVTQTRDPELKGELDDWLARVVCFAFSVSPQALQKMMNRATAQTSKESAEEEGLEPILDWVKGLVDDVIADEFNLPDLEFAWAEDDAVDEQTQATIVEGLVKTALMTPNQGRLKLGLDADPNPAADKLMVMTATGFVLLEANTIEGKQAMQDAFPPPPPSQTPGPGQGGPPGGNPGQPRPGTPKPGQSGPAAKPAVHKLAKAAKPEVLDTSDQENAISDALAPVLDDTAGDVADQVAAGLDKHDTTREHTAEQIAAVAAAVVAGLTFDDLADTTLVRVLATQLRSVATASAVRGVDEAATPAGLMPSSAAYGDAVAAASAAAEARAAEIMGMRWAATGTAVAEKTLSPDSGAQHSIVTTMRAAVADEVTAGLTAGSDAAVIAKAVKAISLFTKTHAATIAATEAMGAGNRGLLEGYKASGVPALRKRWNIMTEACAVCRANAAEGPVVLLHVFASGDTEPPGHPNCRCMLSCEAAPIGKMVGDIEPDDDLDETGIDPELEDDGTDVSGVDDDDLSDIFESDLLAQMEKGWFAEQHPRGADGRFIGVAAEHTVGGKYLKASGIAGHDHIHVVSTKVKKYAGHDTVQSFVDAHPKGKAHALRLLAADHKAGRIKFKAGIPDASNYTKVGEKMGSNPGGTYESPGGTKFYVKEAKSPAHLQNELLANDLYKKVGAETLDPKEFKLGGKPAIGSELVPLGKFDPKNKAHVAEARKDFAAHAFLGNWDAVGLANDNLGMKAGKLAVLDAGGALKYRAQGALKPSFDGHVVEFDTLRAPSINPQAAAVFGGMTAKELKASAAPVLALTDQDIDEAVAKRITDPAAAAEYATVLKARRDDLGKRVKAEASKEKAAKAAAKDAAEAAAKAKAEQEAAAAAATSAAALTAKKAAFKADKTDYQAAKQAGLSLEDKKYLNAEYDNAVAATTHEDFEAAASFYKNAVKQATDKAIAEAPQKSAKEAANQAAIEAGKQKSKSAAVGAIPLDVETSHANDLGRWAKAAGVKTWAVRGGESASERNALLATYESSGLKITAASENSGVKFYTGSGYRQMNKSLRDGQSVDNLSSNEQSAVKKIDKLIKQTSFKEDTIMYRGYGSEAEVQNGAPPPSNLEDHGFTSVSFNPGVARGFSDKQTIYRVRIPKGFPGAAVGRFSSDPTATMHGDEAEVILPRGTRYQVIGRTNNAAYDGTMDVVDVVPILPS